MPGGTWPVIAANHQWDVVQKWRFPIFAEAEAEGVTLTPMWYSEAPCVPSRLTPNTEAAIIEWETALPGMRTLRQLFNQWSFHNQWTNQTFDGQPEDGKFWWPQGNEFVETLATRGWKQLWVLMDGPSQRSGLDEPGTLPGEHWWKSYPVIATPTDWEPGMVKIHQSQINGWTRLCDYLSMMPNVYDSTIGFEAINEPASYRQAVRDTGDTVKYMTYYVDHVLAIFDLIQSYFPTWEFDFYVGGWGYSGEIAIFERTHLPKYGNKTVTQALKDHIGEHRFVWSAHMYPGWTVATYDVNILENWGRNRFGAALGRDRIAVTEFNGQNEIVNAIWSGRDNAIKDFMWNRNQEWFYKNNLSVYWWPLANWADGSVFDARGRTDEDLTMNHQNSYASLMRMMTFNNNLDVMTWADTGIRQATFFPVFESLNALSDPDYEEKRPVDENDNLLQRSVDVATKAAYGFGGRGVAVVEPVEDANNFLYGGNGRNILYGSQTNDDHLNLGRGGGVVRCYGGYNYVNTSGGENLVYSGSHWTEISTIRGKTTHVIDPNATKVIIIGFDANRGDKLSFMGAFQDVSEFRSAVSSRLSETGRDENNAIVALPGGGEVVFWNSGAQANYLYLHVLDFTDGWYQEGWEEPADYTVEEFNDPIVDPPPPWDEEPEVGGIGFLKSGLPVSAFLKSGLPVSIARKWGSAA